MNPQLMGWRSGGRLPTPVFLWTAALLVLWTCYNIAVPFLFQDADLEGSFVLRSLLLLAAVGALWVGLLWGGLVGIAGLFYMLLVYDLASVQQIVFSLVALGLISAFGDAWLRRGFAVVTVLWIVVIVAQVENPMDQRTLGMFLGATVLLVYGVGRGVRALYRRGWETAERVKRVKGEQLRQRDLLIKELHETVARDVTQLSFVVETLENSQAQQTVKSHVESIRASLNGVFRTLRGEAMDSAALREENLSLGDIMRSCASDLRDAGIPVQLEMSDDVDELSPRSAEYIRRILTECTVNVLKYGSRTEQEPDAFCRLSLSRESDSLRLAVSNSVRHTGDMRQPPGFGIGLEIVKDYAELLGGTVHVGPDHKGHWHVAVRRIPLAD